MMKFQSQPPRRPGFTLTEMIVVIAIIAAALAVSFPMLGAMRTLFEDNSGLNTVQVAVTAARAYATRDIASLTNIDANASYSGTAVLFTPGNELRLLENTQLAISTGTNVLESAFLSYRNGYQDIPDRDYLTLPRDVGVVGITRTSTGSPSFLPPPFAVRFNEHGQLVVSDNDTNSRSKLVYYDSDDDGRYRLSGTGLNRSSPYGGGTYDPDLWDPTSGQYASPTQDLPYEEMEAVVGILVYSKKKFRGDGGDWPSTTPTTGCGISGGAPCTNITEWMQTNGTPYFFGRYTGVIFREKN